jgi:hypothetical protein
VQATLAGLDDAKGVLHGRLGLPEPGALEVLLVELGGDLDGYVIPGDRRTRLVLDASPAGGVAGARRAAAHQYAHAMAVELYPQFPSEWAEALATWTAAAVDGSPDPAARGLIAHRLRHLGAGLAATSLDLAAGNAVWFAFLDEAYGAGAVRLTLDELASGAPVAVALDRALRRATTVDLAAAFREFHLWSVLVGPDSDGRHFSFADQLAPPGFASRTRGLPALSVQSDPPVAPLGAVRVGVAPESARGGLSIRFEGEFSAAWDVDVVLLREDGSKHRLAMPLLDGRGDVTVPLDGLADVWLLVRNLHSDADAPRRYTYATHREPDFPFSLTTLEASAVERPGGGILLAWETGSEQQLVGFNVLRVLEDGGSPSVVNPVWIPAMGDSTTPTAYRYLDRSTEPGVAYVYRIVGITSDGLTSSSEPLTIRNP